MLVEGPGKYILPDDMEGNLTIKGEDIIVYGNFQRIQGKMYVSGKNITIYDCIVAPRLTHSFTESVTLKNCHNVLLRNVTVESPVPLDYFATCSPDTDVQFTNCRFNGELFDDPPESKHIQRC